MHLMIVKPQYLGCVGGNGREGNVKELEVHALLTLPLFCNRPKEKGRNGCHSYQSAKHQVLKCPLCAKHTPFSQLYIDK